ncbi:MAG: glycosyltransferase family 4 protein [Betaproteobacteria bacterium]|nr:glycosyltransferase family 4 protein [Betaproteobacteria bacterium]
MSPRPVVLVASPSLDAVSGVTTHALSILRSPLRASFELRHFQVGSEGRAEGPLGRALRLAASPFLLAVAIARHGASVVHLNTSLNARAFWRDALYAAVAKLAGARVVLQKHGGRLDEFLREAPPVLVRAVLRLADAVVVLSRAELAQFARFVPGQHIELVPNGIDVSLYRRSHLAEPTKSAPAGSREPLRLLYLGRLAGGKGLEEIVEAMALLRARGVPATLCIAGSGPMETALRERVGALDLAGVSFAGAAYGAHKVALLAEADVLVLPSHAEGLPYAVLEAMAAGVVPVVTPVGALPDVIEEGVHGLFVPVRDAPAIAAALASLDADRPRLARLGAAARRRAASAYSVERLAAELGGVYSALASARAAKTVL